MKLNSAIIDGKINSKTIKISGDIKSSTLKLGGDIKMASSGAKLPIDYEKDTQLINRPRINNIEVIGNKTSKELKLQDEMNALSVTDIEKILYLG